MTKGVQGSTNSSGWKVWAGQGVVKDEGWGATEWNHIKHPSPQTLFAAIILYGDSGPFEIEDDIYHQRWGWW